MYVRVFGVCANQRDNEIDQERRGISLLVAAGSIPTKNHRRWRWLAPVTAENGISVCVVHDLREDKRRREQRGRERPSQEAAKLPWTMPMVVAISENSGLILVAWIYCIHDLSLLNLLIALRFEVNY